uniref:Ankyrin n=1 Tax=Solibacter usitatus (strain Ellin6076) TaxID=234267 RepID=Q02D28_SOLUE
MSDALPLLPRPNLEQYKKLARDLQGACKSTDPGAVRQWAAYWVETLARLHGSANWPKAEQIERRWNKLKKDNEHLARCTLAGAQFFIAREYGFTSWPKFARHIRELARAHSLVSAFEAAADAIITGDEQTLRQLLAGHPELARERSTREHRSTLLHYVSANGVEDFRQKTPKNIVRITNLLLDAGADVDAESDAYGGGCTALGLVATSVHPEKAGVQIALLQTLLDRGAQLAHRSAAGNNHSIVHGCIANGQPAAARFLAGLGAPLDAESAAVVGRLDLLQSYFDESGARRPEANPKQLESAFLYACGYGSLDAARFLLDRGVDPAARDNQGRTALHWSAWAPEVGSIKLSLEHGAPVDAKDYEFHATPLDTVLWTWNNTPNLQDRERCYEAVTLLARAGAKLDRDHWCDPGKEGSVMLEKIDSDLRMLAALRGEP